MIAEQTPTPTGYWAGRTGAALRDEGDHARLWLGGDDRIAFLQRISTNDVRLAPAQGTVTVLVSATARIQAVLTVLAMPTGLLLLAGPGQGPAIFNTLRTQIFFNDKVALEGRGGALAQFSLLGPQAAGLLAQVAGDVGDLPLFGWRTLAIAGADVTVQRHEGLGSAGFTLLAPAPAALAVKAALLRGGAVPLHDDAYHVLRVEAGVPAPGCELTEQVNPLEAGLRRFCNDHKGCYTHLRPRSWRKASRPAGSAAPSTASPWSAPSRWPSCAARTMSQERNSPCNPATRPPPSPNYPSHLRRQFPEFPSYPCTTPPPPFASASSATTSSCRCWMAAWFLTSIWTTRPARRRCTTPWTLSSA